MGWLSLGPRRARLVSIAGAIVFGFGRTASAGRRPSSGDEVDYADRTPRLVAACVSGAFLAVALLLLAQLPAVAARSFPAGTTVGDLVAGGEPDGTLVSFRGIVYKQDAAKPAGACPDCRPWVVRESLATDRLVAGDHWIVVATTDSLGSWGERVTIVGYVHRSGDGVWIEATSPGDPYLLLVGVLLLALVGGGYAVAYSYPYAGFVPLRKLRAGEPTDEPLPAGPIVVRVTGRFPPGPGARNSTMGLRDAPAVLWRAVDWRAERQRRVHATFSARTRRAVAAAPAFGAPGPMPDVRGAGAGAGVATPTAPAYYWDPRWGWIDEGGAWQVAQMDATPRADTSDLLADDDLVVRDPGDAFEVALRLASIVRIEAGEARLAASRQPALRVWLADGQGQGRRDSRGRGRAIMIGVQTAAIRDGLFRGIVAQARLRTPAPGVAERR